MFKTKQQFIDELLQNLHSTATRHERGSDEQDLLIQDLENINGQIKRLRGVNESEKSNYTWMEIDAFYLEDFKDKIIEAQVKKD